MKIFKTERQKHYVVGTLVVIAIGIVFLPSFLKKANDHFDDNLNLSIRLPSKPEKPVVNIPDEKPVFQPVQVAHVDLSRDTQLPAPMSVKAEPISTQRTTTSHSPKVVEKDVILKKDVVKLKTESKAKTIKASNKPSQKPKYSIQLASFIHKKNAQSLVSRLKKQGYEAYYLEAAGKKSTFYKVFVGSVAEKKEAVVLKDQLTKNVHLQGLIVKTGVS